ncbi:alpha/beta fold hydrolase [Paenibacillus sp.]|uniref:alpha/beta fold hydrolase n=1 Tax=Paenibacillus sp. TaxID=58172 RepID=UPI002D66983C|nr:alpha/beta fold hydrolase [Paenibacillus sp.]HZG55685.1 alpha/beta fold hydrolase [Paenibacillus sp.]
MKPEETTILLLHGFPFGPEMWSRQRATFAAKGCRVVAPDLRLETSPATMDDMAAEAVAALDAAGARQAVVVGFSMGGYVAFALLERYPERVAGLALVDTRAEADGEEGKAGRRKLAAEALERGPQAAVDAMLGKLLSPATRERRPDVAEEAKRIMLSTSGKAIAAAALGMAERPDRTAMLSGIRVPTLVVVGEDDAITPPALARGLADAIPGAALRVLPEAGHLAVMERPEAFDEALAAWLENI